MGRVGDRTGARVVFRNLISRSSRDISDLRTRLLYSYVVDSADAHLLTSR